jgi:hypothetical protein
MRCARVADVTEKLSSCVIYSASIAAKNINQTFFCLEQPSTLFLDRSWIPPQRCNNNNSKGAQVTDDDESIGDTVAPKDKISILLLLLLLLQQHGAGDKLIAHNPLMA